MRSPAKDLVNKLQAIYKVTLLYRSFSISCLHQTALAMARVILVAIVLMALCYSSQVSYNNNHNIRAIVARFMARNDEIQS